MLSLGAEGPYNTLLCAPKLSLAELAVVAPVPPLAIGKVPVTPGVILALPSNEAVEVDANLVRIVLAVANLVALAELPDKLPLNVVALIVPVDG